MSYITEFYVFKIVKYPFTSALSDEEKTAIKGQLLLTFNEPVSQVILSDVCMQFFYSTHWQFSFNSILWIF